MVDVSILIPVSGPVSPSWALALKRLVIPGRFTLHMIKGVPIDVARNTLVKWALKDGAEWIFFLDSDIILDDYALVNLMQWKLPIVSCLYWAKKMAKDKYPNGHWCAWKSIEPEEPLDLKKHLPKGHRLVEVEAVGMGCCLIHRRVFEMLIERGYTEWFKWTLDPETGKGVS